MHPGNGTKMTIQRFRPAIVRMALAISIVAVAGCSSDARSAISDDVQTAVTDVGNAVADGTTAAAEVAARNLATQQGEEQFKNAGHELSGPLTCEAAVNDGVSKIDVSCTGTTMAGGAAALTGSTAEIPGASVVSLDGSFIGTVDGAEVFSTQRLGG
jgi:hypothetical protein